jgi:hypothetical protein
VSRAVSLPSAVDVLVVGAGHAGLAMSSFLAHDGREHVVVDGRDRLGGGWQDRWDEFTLVTPNWTSSFPGWAYEGSDPDGFMGRDEIAARVARYAEKVDAPVVLSTEVLRLTPSDGGGFRVTTSGGELSARQVVVATGSYHTPRVLAWSASISGRVLQLHSHEPQRRFNPTAALTGRGGGHDTNLRKHAADGITLAGRLTGASGDHVTFAGDLTVNLERADSFFDERFRGSSTPTSSVPGSTRRRPTAASSTIGLRS